MKFFSPRRSSEKLKRAAPLLLELSKEGEEKNDDRRAVDTISKSGPVPKTKFSIKLKLKITYSRSAL